MPLDKTVDLPYAFEKVWDTSIQVVQHARWNATKADKTTGSIELKIVMDSITWTETFYVNLARIDDNATRVLMGRIGLSQPFDWGVARQYIDSFFNKLGSTLRDSLRSSEFSACLIRVVGPVGFEPTTSAESLVYGYLHALLNFLIPQFWSVFPYTQRFRWVWLDYGPVL